MLLFRKLNSIIYYCAVFFGLLASSKETRLTEKKEERAAARRYRAAPQYRMEQLLICLSVALIAGLLMSRLAKAIHLPAVTSYLLAGLLLGPFFLGRLGLSNFGIGFGTLEQVDSLSIITQVALGFIAFVIGNEFPVSLD